MSEFAERLHALHADMARALTGLPDEALDWSPGSQMNSLTALALHTAGAERYWIGDVAGQDPSGRDRDAEFRARGWGAVALNRRLADVLAHSRGVLAKLAPGDLGTVHVSPRDGRPYTVAWCLLHALEHDALHLGHMQLVRQLWEQAHSAVQAT